MMNVLTANQHYVWQHYLGAWCSSRKIWCKRIEQQEPFHTSTRNIASERFFYEFKELTKDDLAYIEHIISKSNDERLQKLNRGWVHLSQRTFVLRRELEKQGVSVERHQKLEVELSRINKTLGERFHTKIEGSAVPLLDELRKGSFQFHDDSNHCLEFVFYLCMQYFRTAKIRNAIASIEHDLPIDIDRTWPIEALIYATNVGWSLYRQRLHYRIVLLKNVSDIPFITGDQPVISLRGYMDEAVDFYYPLSSRLAMVYTADCDRYPHDVIEAVTSMVESYNYKIYSSSESMILGNKPDYLRELSNIPKEL